VTTFVHTWHEVGQNWARLWDFLRERPLWEAVNSLGAGWIRDNYPGLGQAIDAAMASGSTVDEARLREFYGTDFVWVDDDRQAPFAGNVNTWKMHYKMYEAQRRATDSGIDFDLYIKIRPDQLLRSRSAVDWHQLFEESVRRRALYADRGYQFTGEIIKLADQFVTGAREPMDAYMSVFPRFTRCIEAKRFPFDGPQFFRAHAAVGFSTLYQGVLVRDMPALEFVKLLNPTIVSPQDVLDLLRMDIASRDPIDFDRQFLAEVEATVGGARL